MKLGINGFGRIGKLTVWHHVARKHFEELVVNLGREAGTSLADVAHYLRRDSTYGSLEAYLHGHSASPVIEDLDESSGTVVVDGVRIRFLRKERDPAKISWGEHDVRLVVDCTGRFRDPTVRETDAAPSLRGHLVSGAEKVVVSAPFKVKERNRSMPSDAVTTVMGINDGDYDPATHRLVSSASCTTTCLAHMMKPLIDTFGSRRILTASMATVHAATGSQEVLDRLPGAGAVDLRKNRGIMNNIILTTTGAATALAEVIPEMRSIGFIAESVRIPTATGSLIILVVNFQEDPAADSVRRELINEVYRQAAARDSRGYLRYTDEQNVSTDIIGFPRAAAVIEGHETHTRSAEVGIDLDKALGSPQAPRRSPAEVHTIRIAITQAVIYGWYDNELGSYVNLLGDRTVSIAELM